MLRLLCLLLWLPPLVLATPAAGQDNYYARDIFQAIDQARSYTHHYDYSSALRYNRTTALSIQMPRLLNQEMAQTSIETPELEPAGALNSTADPMSLPANGAAGSVVGSRELRLDSPATISAGASPVSVTVR